MNISSLTSVFALCCLGWAALGLTISSARAEPQDWIFQGVESDSPTAAGVLFLRVEGDVLTGEWRAGGTTGGGVAVTGTWPRGEKPPVLHFAYPTAAKTATTQLVAPEEDPQGSGQIHLISDLGTEREYHFRAVPVAADATPLPRYDVVFQQGREGIAVLYVSYPRFETAGPDGAHWKAVNARLAEIVGKERATFLAAVKSLPADLAAADPPSFSVQSVIRSRRRDTVSVELTVTSYTGGPHGRARHPSLNYHFRNARFLTIEDLCGGDAWRAALASRLNTDLIQEGAVEEGRAPVSAAAVTRLQWTLDLRQRVVFHLAAEELGPGLPEATIGIPIQDLRAAGLLRPDGPLDTDR